MGRMAARVSAASPESAFGVPGIEQNEIRVEIAQNAMHEQPRYLLLRVSCNNGLSRFAP